MLIIGIDPDLEASGVAIFRNGQIENLTAMDFFDLQEFIQLQNEVDQDLIFAVEDVELNKSLYAKHDGKTGSYSSN